MKQQFDWHPPKAEANWRNHKVTFEQGAKAIGDVFAVDWTDDREDYGEERSNLIGMCDGVLLHVTYTERGERIWIISARKAERHERDYYFRENSS
ncbi:MAG: BrnT family toxin [Magnetococcales bacterium]|nr:BrnT family toxin [Magnetococcales bacterium]